MLRRSDDLVSKLLQDAELHVIDLGVTSYAAALDIQKRILDHRRQGTFPDTLILTSHNPPAITLGRDKKWNTLKTSEENIRARGIELHPCTEDMPRGGGAAYLGPHHLIGYTIMEITRYGGIKNFLMKLEEAMIHVGDHYGIPIRRHESMNPTTEKPYRATWYEREGKFFVLCTKGIGIKRTPHTSHQYSHHGFSLHVHEDHGYEGLIDPCGFPTSEIRPISMQEILGRPLDLNELKRLVVEKLSDVLHKTRTTWYTPPV